MCRGRQDTRLDWEPAGRSIFGVILGALIILVVVPVPGAFAARLGVPTTSMMRRSEKSVRASWNPGHLSRPTVTASRCVSQTGKPIGQTSLASRSAMCRGRQDTRLDWEPAGRSIFGVILGALIILVVAPVPGAFAARLGVRARRSTSSV
jgi:hypothetical protein